MVATIGLRLDVGQAAAWVSAAATVAAFVAAVIAATQTGRTLAVERGRDERDALHRRMYQARDVVIWPADQAVARQRELVAKDHTAEGKQIWSPEGPLAYSSVSVYCLNASPLHVFDARLEGRLSVTHPSTGEVRRQTAVTEIGVLAPRGDADQPPTRQTVRFAPPVACWPDAPFVTATWSCTLHFRDSAGVVWQRDLNGELAESRAGH